MCSVIGQIIKLSNNYYHGCTPLKTQSHTQNRWSGVICNWYFLPLYLYWGNFAFQGNIWQCWGHFLLLQLGSSYVGI